MRIQFVFRALFVILLCVTLGYGIALVWNFYPLLSSMWNISQTAQVLMNPTPELVADPSFANQHEWFFNQIEGDLAVIDANQHLLDQFYFLDLTSYMQSPQYWEYAMGMKTLRTTMLSEYLSLAEMREYGRVPEYTIPFLAAMPEWAVSRLLQHGAVYIAVILLGLLVDIAIMGLRGWQMERDNKARSQSRPNPFLRVSSESYNEQMGFSTSAVASYREDMHGGGSKPHKQKCDKCGSMNHKADLSCSSCGAPID
jgi:hypothetical protein